MILGGERLGHAFRSDTWKAFRGQARLGIADLEPLIGANSIDVTLHSSVLMMTESREVVDLRQPLPSDVYTAISDIGEPGFPLHPGQFVLGAVRERFECSTPLALDGRGQAWFVQIYEGRSTLGRLGIGSHVTAGFGDFGFGGAFTLELHNLGRRPVLLRPGMRIGQIAFHEVYSPQQYKGGYAGIDHYDGPVAPKLGANRV